MKYLIILGDGMADWPVPALDNKTLLQYAHTPNMDRLARMGRTGMLRTVADGFHPGSEVANMSVLGYDLSEVYEGRGVLEAANIGVDLAPDEIAARCNLVCIEGDILKNHSSGHIHSRFISRSGIFSHLVYLYSGSVSSGKRSEQAQRNSPMSL